jgi:hypothetical protein
MLSISVEKLRELISSAYESGWGGCLEFKSEYTEQTIESLVNHQPPYAVSSFTLTTSPMHSSENLLDCGISFSPANYSYLDNAGLGETIFLNEPGEEIF